MPSSTMAQNTKEGRMNNHNGKTFDDLINDMDDETFELFHTLLSEIETFIDEHMGGWQKHLHEPFVQGLAETLQAMEG